MNNQFFYSIEVVATLIASISFVFGVYQYLLNKTLKIKQILRIIYTQLEIFGAWAGVGGKGYGKELTTEQKFDNANPFKMIYEIQNNLFIQTALLDELNFVPTNILEKINEFNQNIVRISNIQNFRNQIATADIDLSWQIKELIDSYQNDKSVSFEDFLQKIEGGQLKPIDKEEQKYFNKSKALRLVNKLVYYGEKIHCEIIGDSKSNGMKEQLEIIKNWAEKELVNLHQSNFMKLTNFLLSKDFLLRYVVIILVITGIILKSYNLYFLIASGLLLGIYYGMNNDIIWRPKGELSTSFSYRTHQLWIHIVCGIVASISLYFLLGVIDFNNQAVTLSKLGLKEFILFIITLLGYVGLLPRILWFFSYAQNIFSNK